MISRLRCMGRSYPTRRTEGRGGWPAGICRGGVPGFWCRPFSRSAALCPAGGAHCRRSEPPPAPLKHGGRSVLRWPLPCWSENRSGQAGGSWQGVLRTDVLHGTAPVPPMHKFWEGARGVRGKGENPFAKGFPPSPDCDTDSGAGCFLGATAQSHRELPRGRGFAKVRRANAEEGSRGLFRF